jgi:undecaprenyl-diphosphatase
MSCLIAREKPVDSGILVCSMLQAILLGVIQGITEFLPVSSSGHLILFQNLLAIPFNNVSILFNIILHLATLLAVVLLLKQEIRRFFGKTSNLFYLGSSFFFTAIIGYFIAKFEVFFGQSLVVGWMLLLNGVVLFLGGKVFFNKNNRQKLDLKKAVIIGIVQGLAVIPGISRSGITISCALMLGLAPSQAFSFSFILAIPTILAAFSYKLLSCGGTFQNINLFLLLSGFSVAFACGLISLWFLKKFILKLHYFAGYCFLVGCWVILL